MQQLSHCKTGESNTEIIRNQDAEIVHMTRNKRKKKSLSKDMDTQHGLIIGASIPMPHPFLYSFYQI